MNARIPLKYIPFMLRIGHGDVSKRQGKCLPESDFTLVV